MSRIGEWAEVKAWKWARKTVKGGLWTALFGVVAHGVSVWRDGKAAQTAEKKKEETLKSVMRGQAKDMVKDVVNDVVVQPAWEYTKQNFVPELKRIVTSWWDPSLRWTVFRTDLYNDNPPLTKKELKMLLRQRVPDAVIGVHRPIFPKKERFSHNLVPNGGYDWPRRVKQIDDAVKRGSGWIHCFWKAVGRETPTNTLLTGRGPISVSARAAMLLPSAAPLFVFDPTRFQLVAIPPLTRYIGDERSTALPNPPFEPITYQSRDCLDPTTGIAVLHQAMRADRASDFTDGALTRLQPEIEATFGPKTPVCAVARSKPFPPTPSTPSPTTPGLPTATFNDEFNVDCKSVVSFEREIERGRDRLFKQGGPAYKGLLVVLSGGHTTSAVVGRVMHRLHEKETRVEFGESLRRNFCVVGSQMSASTRAEESASPQQATSPATAAPPTAPTILPVGAAADAVATHLTAAPPAPTKQQQSQN